MIGRRAYACEEFADAGEICHLSSSFCDRIITLQVVEGSEPLADTAANGASDVHTCTVRFQCR